MVIDKGDELIFAFETSFIWLFGGTSVITHFIYKCIKIVKLKFYSSYSSKRSIDQAKIILIEGSDKFIYRYFFFGDFMDCEINFQIGTQDFWERLKDSLTFSIGFLAGSTLALWISMCSFTTFDSAPEKRTVFPMARTSLSWRKALTTPV